MNKIAKDQIETLQRKMESLPIQTCFYRRRQIALQIQDLMDVLANA